MLRKLALLAAISPALWLSSAAALGLGEIDVRSALNQRFAATIPLTAVSAEEAENVQISLANYAEFQRAGLERSEYLSSLKFAVRTDGGAPRIEVSSGQIAREPFVNFLVEVRSRGNRLLREYTVLLDPPGFQPPPSAPPVAVAPAQPVAAPVAAPVAPPVAITPAAPAAKPAAAAPRATTPDFFETSEESATRSSAPAPAKTQAPVAEVPAQSPPASPASGSGDSYGPVKAGETFWSIAAKLRDPSATMPQMLLAIYEGNRAAFDGGINGLRVGSTLQVPSLEQISSVPPAAAKARVDSLRAGGSSAPAKPRAVPAEPVIPAPKAEAPVVAPKPAPPKVEPAPVAKPAPVQPIKPAEPAEPAEPIKPEPVKPVEPAKPAVVSPPPAAAIAPPPAVVEPPSSPAVPETPAAPAAGDAAAATADPAAEAAVVPVPTEEQASPEIPVEQAVPAPVEESEGGLIEWLIPLIGLLLIVGGVGYMVSNLLKKRKEGKSAPVAPAPAAAKASLVKPVLAAPAAKTTVADLQRLDETMGDATANFETQQFQTQQIPVLAQQPEIRRIDGGSEATSQLPTFDSTQSFGLAEATAKKTTLGSGDIDFDLTGQFAAETVQINLDANDPIAEADFHLAYGLYDEAILLLKQAGQKDPGRSELGVKLAETYFAAGRPLEFQETAESLQGRLDPGNWQKIAIMGQQLCPDADLFKGAEMGAMSTDVDLLFGDSEEIELPEVAELPELEEAPTAQDNGLDFRLEELELPKLDTTVKPDTPELKTDNALEFDLGDFDLSNEPKAASPAVAEKGNAVEFDLKGVDLGGFDAVTGTIPAKGDPADTGVQLDDFDLGDLGSDSDSISSGDETSTKLDLARAYVDMGDNEMARSLLTEVLAQGSDAQKNEAQNLISRLS